MRHPLCKAHYREAIEEDRELTLSGYFIPQLGSLMKCIWCEHDEVLRMESRSQAEAAERAWARGEVR